MKSWFLIVVAVVAMLVRCFADTTSTNGLHESEVAEIKHFLSDFANVLNSNDAKRIKQMSGSAWAHFSKRMDCDEKVDGFEIVKLSTDKVTNVVTKATVVDAKGNPFNVEVIFDLKNVDGVYSIDKMRLPESERLHEELEAAYKNFRTFIEAINTKNIEKLKDTLTFGNVEDFDSELAARDLLWVTRVVGNNLSVISDGFARTGIEEFWGNVIVLCDSGGTNVLHEVIFKGLKIDRAAPRKETYEEFCKRIAAEQESARKQYNEKCAAEYKRQNAEALERLKKELKEAGVLK